jgi:prepilin-type N-terminal cleavage/methylation domain-containing protein
MNRNLQGQQGFTLIELMIVIMIISVLLSLALPAYQDYTTRAKAAEGLSVASAAKLAIEETCQTHIGADIRTQTGYSFEASTYVASVNILGTCEISVIAVQTQNTGAERDPMIWLFRRRADAPSRFFNVLHGNSWYCFGWPDQAHLPSRCRLRNISG